MRRSKILVTGATGMLGRSLVRQWSDAHEVIGISRRGSEDILSCDLSRFEETERLFRQNNFSLVAHTAAYSDVDGCERDPKLAHASNALATRHLAALCGKKKIPFIYVSTDYVFDGQKRSPYTESDAVGPVNIYGMTKLEGEIHARDLSWISAIVRTSWLFGAGNPRNFVNQIAERLKNESTVSVLADQRDCPTYVKDLAAALENIASGLRSLADRRPRKTISETYHVCNTGVTTRHGMALKIKDFLGLKNKRVLLADPSDIAGRLAVRPAHAAMSTARYQKTFKAPLRRWEEALEDYLARGVL